MSARASTSKASSSSGESMLLSKLKLDLDQCARRRRTACWPKCAKRAQRTCEAREGICISQTNCPSEWSHSERRAATAAMGALHRPVSRLVGSSARPLVRSSARLLVGGQVRVVAHLTLFALRNFRLDETARQVRVLTAVGSYVGIAAVKFVRI